MRLTTHLVEHKVIRPTLTALALDGQTLDRAVELLLGTAAAESHMGEYLRQLGGGPALGLWQIEPETEWDVWNNFLTFRPALRQTVRGWQTGSNFELEWNHAYSCAIARLIYYRMPGSLPEAGDVLGQALYWKKYYNTYKGKGTPEHYMECWKQFVEGQRTRIDSGAGAE